MIETRFMRLTVQCFKCGKASKLSGDAEAFIILIFRTNRCWRERLENNVRIILLGILISLCSDNQFYEGINKHRLRLMWHYSRTQHHCSRDGLWATIQD